MDLADLLHLLAGQSLILSVKDCRGLFSRQLLRMPYIHHPLPAPQVKDKMLLSTTFDEFASKAELRQVASDASHPAKDLCDY